MLVSVVIPAYNEAPRVGAAVRSAVAALRACGVAPWEVIVADDASTDGTADAARAAGARVVFAGKRNIGATRNVGARAASGRYLVFLDADTFLNAGTMGSALRAFRRGAVGGGARLRWSKPTGRAAERMLETWNWISTFFRLPAGSFFFVRRDCFFRVGGFNERWFASEEIHLGRALHKVGRLAILRARIATSPRKLREFSAWEFLRTHILIALRPFTALQRREGLFLWYERREGK